MSGHEASGNLAAADCVIAHSFGSSIGPGSVNQQLASQMVGLADGRPMLADRTLVDALPPGVEGQMALIVDGPRTNIRGQGVGTWGTLLKAKRYMEEHDLHLALMIAQAHHAPRVVKQAAKN